MVGLLPEKHGAYDRLYGSIILPSSIVEFYPDPTLVIDNRRRVVAWNKAMEKMTGVASSEMIDRGDYEYAIPFYGERKPILVDMVGMAPEDINERYTNVVVDGDKVEAMTITATLKGKEAILWGTAARLYGMDGELVGAIECIRDVSDQWKARQELKKAHDELELRVQAVLDTIPAGIIVADAGGDRISYTNQSAVGIFGPHIAEIHVSSGRRPYKLLEPDGAPMKPADRPLNRSIRKGEYVHDREMVVCHPDGRRISVLMSSAPVIDGGRIIGGVASAIDITGRKSSEQALKEAKDQAELYLDLMGHDINNMNQAAMGYVELAAALLSDARALPLLGRSLVILQDSSRLIDNLRKIQQAVGGKMRLEPVDLNVVLSQVKAEYSPVPGRNVTIAYRPGTGRVVRANQLLKDVFSNIVDNAIKHSTGDLRVTISTRAVPGHYEVSIEDNGPGIADDLKPAIFSRSRRGATKARGSGLGLYLVRSLVEGFSGRVRVEDRVRGDSGKGCRFVVTLPAAEAHRE